METSESTYGPRQARQAWYIKIDKYLNDQGFQSPLDSNLYVKTIGGDYLLLVIYVDDLIITSSSALLIEQIKQSLRQSFDMVDLGLLHYCLGVEIWQTNGSIFISQSKYARSLLDKFQMQDCKPASTPMEKGLKLSANSDSPVVDESLFRQLVGSLIYLTTTRLDLSYVVSYISRFMTVCKADHWVAMKRVLRYAKGTSDFGILYGRSKDPRLIGFRDSDWVGYIDDKKSTSGYVFSLGTGAVTWTNKKQQAVVLVYVLSYTEHQNKISKDTLSSHEQNHYLCQDCEKDHKATPRSICANGQLYVGQLPWLCMLKYKGDLRLARSIHNGDLSFEFWIMDFK